MVSLRTVTVDNFWEIIELKVSEEQEEFVAANAVSIAQSKVQPECIPLAVYNDDTPVGFLMYCVDRDDGEYWLYRLMIDSRFQGNGYARDAMHLFLKLVKEDKSKNKIFLGVDINGGASLKLYESLGFKFTGQVYGKESIMVLEY